MWVESLDAFHRPLRYIFIQVELDILELGFLVVGIEPGVIELVVFNDGEYLLDYFLEHGSRCLCTGDELFGSSVLL